MNLAVPPIVLPAPAAMVTVSDPSPPVYVSPPRLRVPDVTRPRVLFPSPSLMATGPGTAKLLVGSMEKLSAPPFRSTLMLVTGPVRGGPVNSVPLVELRPGPPAVSGAIAEVVVEVIPGQGEHPADQRGGNGPVEDDAAFERLDARRTRRAGER